MNVQHLDDHVPAEDRESVALLRRRAEGVPPSRGPDLDDVLGMGRRHVRRRHAAAAAGIALAGLVALAVVEGTERRESVPAAPGPDVTVVPVERSAADFYDRVDDALADAGVETDRDLRWRSQRKMQDGVLWSGFRTEAYVPATGSSLVVTSLRREDPAEKPAAPGGPAGCQELLAYHQQAGEDAVCEESEVEGGDLVTLRINEWTVVGLITPSTVVQVETDVSTLGSGPQLENPRALPEATLVELATDPRLRW